MQVGENEPAAAAPATIHAAERDLSGPQKFIGSTKPLAKSTT